MSFIATIKRGPHLAQLIADDSPALLVIEPLRFHHLVYRSGRYAIADEPTVMEDR